MQFVIKRNHEALLARQAQQVDQAREAANARIVREIEAVTLRITGVVPAAEMLAWASKEAAARAYLSGDSTGEQGAILTGEAQQTGEQIEDLAARIIANADSYRAIIATLTGLRRKAAAIIAAMQTEVEIEAAVQETMSALAQAFHPESGSAPPASGGAIDSPNDAF